MIESWKPNIKIDPEWKMVELGEAPCIIIDGDRGLNYPRKGDYSSTGYCLFLSTKNVRSNGFNFSEVEFISKEKDDSLRKGKLSHGDVVLTTRGTIGNTAIYNKNIKFDHIRINSGMLIFRPDTTKILGNFLFYFFQSSNFYEQRDAITSGVAQPQLPIRNLNEAKIPLPPIEVQKKIVAEIEAEQKIVEANKTLIERYEQKIKNTIEEVWGRGSGETKFKGHLKEEKLFNSIF